MVIWENTESTNNVVRLWNNEQTITAILDLGVGANGIQFRLQPGIVMLNDAELRVNTINTNGNNNLILQQNNSTIATYDKDDGSYPSGIFKFDTDVSVRTDKFIQCNTLRAHIFDSHPTLQTGDNDISFRYAGVIYMFYDKSLSNLQMRTDINSTNDITCVALTHTSDKRLKTDIQTITTNCRIRCFAFFCCARTVVLKSFLGKLVKSYLGSLKTLLDGVCVGEMPKTSCGGFLLGRMPKHEG